MELVVTNHFAGLLPAFGYNTKENDTMPRIYTSTNDALDFCAQCIPSEGVAYSLYGKLGNGPDNRGNCFGYDAEHPDYEGEGYQCETCKKTLTALDNETVPALAWDDPRCYRIDAEGNKY